MHSSVFFFVAVVAMLVINNGCSAKRTAHEKMMAPDWVRSTPQNPFYYHGVAMAPKTPFGDFRERARQAALSELAASISVNISSNSMLNQFEFDNSFSEFFRDNITVTTQQYLEGAEVVGNWETPSEYWVYYRLSKSEYERVKQERIRRALELSVSRYEQAKQFAGQGRSIEALGFLVQAVEDISDFAGEDLMIERNGARTSYPTLLNATIVSQLDNLSIVFPASVIALKPGSSQALQPTQVIVRDDAGRVVSGVPVTYRISWIPGRTFHAITDVSGSFPISLQGLKPSHTNELFIAEINFPAIVSSNTRELTVRRLLNSYSSKRFSMTVEAIPPVFYLQVEMERSAPGQTSGMIHQELRKLVAQNGLELGVAATEADYLLNVSIETTSQNQQGNRFTASIRAHFQVTDNNGSILYNLRTDEITGVGNSAASAIESAHQSLINRISINFFPGIMNVLF